MTIETSGLQESSNPSPNINVSVDNSDPPGRHLRGIRKKNKLSIDTVANDLHLPVKTIKLLEADDYEELHAPAFVNGYLRSYAKLLNVDPEPIVARFESLHKACPELASISNVRKTESHAFLRNFLAIVILLALCGLISIWWINWQKSTTTPIQESSVSQGQQSAISESVDETEYGFDSVGNSLTNSENVDISGILISEDSLIANEADVSQQNNEARFADSSIVSEGNDGRNTLFTQSSPEANAYQTQSSETLDSFVQQPQNQLAENWDSSNSDIVQDSARATNQSAQTSQKLSDHAENITASSALEENIKSVPNDVTESTTAEQTNLTTNNAVNLAGLAAEDAKRNSDDRLTASSGSSLTSVSIKFNEECWVELYDADNNRLVYDLFNSDKSIRLDTKLPARLRLGLGSAVTSVKLDGKILQHPKLQNPYTVEFTLPAN